MSDLDLLASSEVSGKGPHGRPSPAVCNITAWGLEQSESTLDAANMFESIYNELQQELLGLSGEDIGTINQQQKPPNFISTGNWERLRISLSNIRTKVISGIVPIFSIKGFVKWQDLNTTNRAEEYIVQRESRGVQGNKVVKGEEDFNTDLNGAIGIVPSRDFENIERLGDGFRHFISPQDIPVLELQKIDPGYKIHSGDEEVNTLNVPSDIAEILCNMLSDTSSVIHNYPYIGSLRKQIKVYILLSLLINYLYGYADDETVRKTEYLAVLSCYHYMLELQSEVNENSAKLNGSRMRKMVFGENVSGREYIKFEGSSLYSLLINQTSISGEIKNFVARVAFSQPSSFINSNEIPFQRSVSILTTIDDPKRQDAIIAFMKGLRPANLLEDEDLALIFFLGIENVTYIHQLTQGDVAFLLSVFCDEESGEVKICRDVNTLYSMDYDDFVLMRRNAEESEHGGALVAHLLSSPENSLAAINFMRTTTPFKKDMSYIPACFTELYERAAQVTDLSGKAYERDTGGTQRVIDSINTDPTFIALKDAHIGILSHFPQEEEDDVMSGIGGVYPSISRRGDIYSQIQFVEGLVCLNLGQLQDFSRLSQGQDLSRFDIFQIPEDNRGAFVHYMVRNECGDDMTTACELFQEEEEEKQGRKKLALGSDINQQFQLLFGDEVGRDLMSIGFSDLIIRNIIHFCLNIQEEWMIPLLGIFLVENKNQIHSKLSQDSERFARKFEYLSRIWTFMHSIGIRVIADPKKLFEHTLLGDVNKKNIHFLLKTFDENDFNADENYDKTVRVIIRYLRDRKPGILDEYFGLNEDVPDSVGAVETNGKKKKRHSRRGSHEFGTGANIPEVATQYWHKFCEVSSAAFMSDAKFLDVCGNILDEEIQYDKEVYANIIINWHTLEGNKDNQLLEGAIKRLKIATGELSLETIGKLFETIPQNEYSNSQVGNILNTCKKTIGASTFSRLSEHSVSDFFYAMSFLSEYQQAQEIIDLFLKRNNVNNIVFISSHHIRRALYGLYEYRDFDSLTPLINSLFKAMRNITKFSDNAAKGVMQIFEFYNETPTKHLEKAFEVSKAQDPAPNQWEEQVATILRKYFKPVLTGQYVGAFEADTLIPMKDANIEFDGIDYHQSGWDEASDDRRDAHLGNTDTPHAVYRIRSDGDIEDQAMLIVQKLLAT